MSWFLTLGRTLKKLDGVDMMEIGSTSLIITVVFFLNPFGIKDAAEEQYQNNIITLLAPTYRQTLPNTVVVILIDHAFLEQYDGYPTSYLHLSRLLKNIATFEPKVLFFDFLQHDEHSPHFSRWLKLISKQSFPVMLASDPQYDFEMETSSDSKYTIRKALFHASKEQFVAVTWEGNDNYYPLMVEHRSKLTPSPAFAMYQTHCVCSNGACETSIGGEMSPQHTRLCLEKEPQPMLVRWSMLSHQTQEELFHLKEECRSPFTRGTLGRIVDMISLNSSKGLYSDDEFDRQYRTTCPPILAVSASKLMQKEFIYSELAQQVLSNKMVLVGYHLGSGIDTVVSPIHGSLPGVFYHAMALDNLNQYGSEYWHMPEEDVIAGLDFNDLIELIVTVISVIIYGVVTNLFIDIKQALFYKKSLIKYRYRPLALDYVKIQLDEAISTNRTCVVLYFCPILFIIMSILLSEFTYQLGIANWYAIPLITLFSAPLLFFIVLSSIVLLSVRKRVREYKAVLTSSRFTN